MTLHEVGRGRSWLPLGTAAAFVFRDCVKCGRCQQGHSIDSEPWGYIHSEYMGCTVP